MRPGTVSGNHHMGLWDLELHRHPWSAAGTPQHLPTALILTWIHSGFPPATHPRGSEAGLDQHSSFENPPSTCSSQEIPWDILTQHPEEASLHLSRSS